MTTQALARKESLAVQTARELNITDARLQLVKDTFAKGATDDELSLFLLTAHRTGLDPMARQLFVVKRYDANVQKSVMSIQISIDGFRLIADRTGHYVPGRESTVTYNAERELESATAYVKKLVAGTWHEISATAFYSEYVQTTKEGKPNRMWQKMPRLMLQKCAESLALRKAFPAELSGLYTADEMGTVAAPTDTENLNQPNPSLPVAAFAQKSAKPEAEPVDKQIGEICKKLNEAKDSVEWTSANLTDWANHNFELRLDSWRKLDDEAKNVLLADLTMRYEEMTAIKTESADEAIDGEIVEESPASPDDEEAPF